MEYAALWENGPNRTDQEESGPTSVEERMIGLQNTEAGIGDLYQLNMRDDLAQTLMTSIIIRKDK